MHHISLVELNFNEDKSDERAGIFRFKIVLSNTDSRYGCKNYAKRTPWEKATQQATDLLKCEKMGSV